MRSCSASLCHSPATVTWSAVRVKAMSDLPSCRQQARARLHANWLNITEQLTRCLFLVALMYCLLQSDWAALPKNNEASAELTTANGRAYERLLRAQPDSVANLVSRSVTDVL